MLQFLSRLVQKPQFIKCVGRKLKANLIRKEKFIESLNEGVARSLTYLLFGGFVAWGTDSIMQQRREGMARLGIARQNIYSCALETEKLVWDMLQLAGSAQESESLPELCKSCKNVVELARFQLRRYGRLRRHLNTVNVPRICGNHVKIVKSELMRGVDYDIGQIKMTSYMLSTFVRCRIDCHVVPPPDDDMSIFNSLITGTEKYIGRELDEGDISLSLSVEALKYRNRLENLGHEYILSEDPDVRSKQVDEATEYFTKGRSLQEKVLGLRPYEVKEYTNLAIFDIYYRLFDDTHKLTKALALTKVAREIAPGDKNPVMVLFWIFLLEGLFREVILLASEEKDKFTKRDTFEGAKLQDLLRIACFVVNHDDETRKICDKMIQ